MHVVWPRCVVKNPGLQSEHAALSKLWLDTCPNFPSEQRVHCSKVPLPLRGLNRAKGQPKHKMLPDTFWKKPVGQKSQML